jgi:hypothetical protein
MIINRQERQEIYFNIEPPRRREKRGKACTSSEHGIVN